MIDPGQMLEYVVRPTLAVLQLGGVPAEQIMMGTAVQESRCGEWLVQRGGGPAKGVWQMEMPTHNDLWNNFLDSLLHYKLALRVKQLMVQGMPMDSQLVVNLGYACAMARVLYYRVPEPLPAAGDWAGQAGYYKLHYNTPLGAATEAEYLTAAGVIKGLWP